MSRYVNPAAKVLAAAKRHSAKISVTASCLNCLKSYTEKMPWFDQKNFKCPACGGDIDPEPFRQLAKQAAIDLRSAFDAFKSRRSSNDDSK